MGFGFKFKKISIKQAFAIKKNFPSSVKTDIIHPVSLITIHFEAQKVKICNLFFSKPHGFSPIIAKQAKAHWSHYIRRL
jgi:hypothetical protein